MGVHDIVPRPSKWVFRIKRRTRRRSAKVQSPIFTQIEGVNYNETFVPFAKLASETLRDITKLDVLYEELKEEIFTEPPPNFDVPEGMVLHHVKAVYGPKQGGRVWYEEIRAKLGAIRCQHRS